jgi:hypothetical protein
MWGRKGENEKLGLKDFTKLPQIDSDCYAQDQDEKQHLFVK